MAALPKSPAGARRGSSGSGLRPVLPFNLDVDGSDSALDEEDLEPLPHMGREPHSGDFPSGASVDEVEYAYGQVIISFLPWIRLTARCSV
jgi:hypothetical protein